MTTTLLIGLDGHSSGDRALAFGESQAKLIGDAELIVAYVIEWSPFSFQTQEENAQRHERRENEIAMATSRIIDPAVEKMKAAGINAKGVVRHGDVAQTLIDISKEENADQIVIARTSEGGFSKRIFGSATSNLVMSADIPVTVVK
ncbi:universal stress protein [Terasakiella sp. A23]|uniref:universal stress protein n=1 Tax=Terasakiella sp. FCG-A23 TaxID=3080561 RepID=UPI002955B232|nr:universal stress protein [Terasakiella sp. A23]MDV7341404.1 universal stress protein [Terasakiella sp. A23]